MKRCVPAMLDRRHVAPFESLDSVPHVVPQSIDDLGRYQMILVRGLDLYDLLLYRDQQLGNTRTQLFWN